MTQEWVSVLCSEVTQHVEPLSPISAERHLPVPDLLLIACSSRLQ